MENFSVSVIRGVGEMDVNKGFQNRPLTTNDKESLAEHLDLEYQERPYLIVDLRDRDDFRMNHIISGKNESK